MRETRDETACHVFGNNAITPQISVLSPIAQYERQTLQRCRRPVDEDAVTERGQSELGDRVRCGTAGAPRAITAGGILSITVLLAPITAPGSIVTPVLEHVARNPNLIANHDGRGLIGKSDVLIVVRAGAKIGSLRHNGVSADFIRVQVIELNVITDT